MVGIIRVPPNASLVKEIWHGYQLSVRVRGKVGALRRKETVNFFFIKYREHRNNHYNVYSTAYMQSTYKCFSSHNDSVANSAFIIPILRWKYGIKVDQVAQVKAESLTSINRSHCGILLNMQLKTVVMNFEWVLSADQCFVFSLQLLFLCGGILQDWVVVQVQWKLRL